MNTERFRTFIADFTRLQAQYPVVSWTVIRGTPPSGFACPYQQQGYAVCRLAGAPAAPLAAAPLPASQHALHRAPLFWQNRSGEHV